MSREEWLLTNAKYDSKLGNEFGDLTPDLHSLVYVKCKGRMVCIRIENDGTSVAFKRKKNYMHWLPTCNKFRDLMLLAAFPNA